jgi:hypothetical protein
MIDTRALFVALVAAVALLGLRPIRRAGGNALASGIVVLYLAVPAALARAGALDRYNPLPAPALVLVLALTIVTVATALSPFGRRLASSVGVAALIGFQSFRVAVEWLLHRLFAEGVIPVEMTYAGRNFDIVSGLTAAAIGTWLASGHRLPRGWLLAWNCVGLMLLVNIVTIAVLATPVSFRQITAGPPNLLPSTFPYVWLPTVLVQAALLGHLLIFRALPLSRSGSSATRP